MEKLPARRYKSLIQRIIPIGHMPPDELLHGTVVIEKSYRAFRINGVRDGQRSIPLYWAVSEGAPMSADGRGVSGSNRPYSVVARFNFRRAIGDPHVDNLKIQKSKCRIYQRHISNGILHLLIKESRYYNITQPRYCFWGFYFLYLRHWRYPNGCIPRESGDQYLGHPSYEKIPF